MNQTEKLIQSVYRAMKAEEKQGFINTGAIGGFSDYLLDAIFGMKEIFSAEALDRIKRIAVDYKEMSPYKRRELWCELQNIFDLQCSFKTSELIQGAVDSRDVKVTRVFQITDNKTSRQTPSLQYVKGVGPQRAKLFEELRITSVEDLLKYYPRRYETRVTRKIEDLKDGELATISGSVTGSQISQGRIKVVKLNIEQDGRSIHAVWFNQIHIFKQYPIGTEVTVTGKVQWHKRIPELLATEIVKGKLDGPEEKMVPVYSETARLNSKIIRGIIKTVLPEAEGIFTEFLPEGETNLMLRPQAYKEIHFPSSPETMKKARERLVVEEILFLQLALARLRSPKHTQRGLILDRGTELVQKLILLLPFRLTEAQKRVIKEVFRDMADGEKAMTRLIQGDVGSGKTVVAMSALLQAVGSGFQAAMMAPTEVLAQQHYESLKDAFEPLGVHVVLLAGNQGKADREQILAKILSGKAQVIVGTQALIQETVQFNCLGLVVTDEQHRFGVRQRTLLQDKGENVHVLVMTATPIPRTLALTLYGDLQLSVIDEMPAGRKPIITRKISERSRTSLEKFLEQQIADGRQVFVVCPLVEETEKSDLVSATKTAESLQGRFSRNKVAILHGKMKSQEKEEIMQNFRGGKIDILVATTVVEVGINVPNASIMVVEGAERFGLAQLHQLRGRVGRGKEQSYCILVSNIRDNARLNILCETEDGFKIAEEDLKIRGPGELLGLRQHGVPELKLTDLSIDGKSVEIAYRLLQKILADPQKYEKLHQEVNRRFLKEKVGVN